MELEEAIKRFNEIKEEYNRFDGLKEYVEAMDFMLNHLKKQEKMIESAKDRIEYYLIGNSTLNDFNVREKELEKLLKILTKAEESE